MWIAIVAIALLGIIAVVGFFVFLSFSPKKQAAIIKRKRPTVQDTLVWPQWNQPKQSLARTFEIFFFPETSPYLSCIGYQINIRNDGIAMLLDTGSANFVVDDAPPVTSILSTANCQTAKYGFGSTVQLCPGTCQLSFSTNLLAALVVRHASAPPGMIPPSNIMGLNPGEPGAKTPIVRQFGIVSQRIDMQNKTWTISPTPLPVLANAVPVVSWMSSNLIILPQRIKWKWSNGTNESWNQVLINGKAVVLDSNGKSNPSYPQAIYFMLDTGTSMDITSLESGTSPQYPVSNDRYCKGVALTCAAYTNQRAYSLTDLENLTPSQQHDYVLGFLNAKGPKTKFKFHFSPVLQKPKNGSGTTMSMPMLKPNMGNQLSIIVGISAMVQSYSYLQIDHDPQSNLIKSVALGGNPVMPLSY